MISAPAVALFPTKRIIFFPLRCIPKVTAAASVANISKPNVSFVSVKLSPPSLRGGIPEREMDESLGRLGRPWGGVRRSQTQGADLPRPCWAINHFRADAS